MVLIRQSSVRLVRASQSINLNANQTRTFISLTPIVQEGTSTNSSSSSSSQKLNADFAAALSRAVAQQQQPRLQNSDRNRQRRNDNNTNAGRQRDDGRSSSLSNRRPRSFSPRKRPGQDLLRRPIQDGSPIAKVQKNIAPTTDWESNKIDSVPFSRVPYALPKIDLQTLKENSTKQNTPKTWRPLRLATKMLRLIPTKSGNLVQGGWDNPTTVAREGISKGAEPLKLAQREVKEGANEKSVSIAKEAREARIQAIRETVGGDYERYEINKFIHGKDALAKDVAHAVASNDDLAPTHKSFTAKSIQQILNKN